LNKPINESLKANILTNVKKVHNLQKLQHATLIFLAINIDVKG